MSGRGPGVYDAVELRRRIAVCFSVSELRALAESLGVGGITWERGVDEAAREVVKQSERYAGLPALVARLRELRPLVEWPEPAGAAAEAPPAPPPAAVPLPPTLASAAPPPLAPTPGTLGGVEPAAVPLHDPYAPPPGAAVIQAPAAPAALPRAPAPWPGTAAAAPTPARGVDPRILVAVAALMVIAAGLAFLAGRSSTPAATATPAASASARPGGRPDGPAARAADALARSYDELARVCELPSGAGANELVFRRVFEHCGPSVPTHHVAAATSRTPAAEPTEPAPSTEPAPPRAGTHPARGDAPSGGAPAARGCVGQCDAAHAACRGHCGPEPTESSAYDTYQHCLGRCLSEASHCRLGCR